MNNEEFSELVSSDVRGLLDAEKQKWLRSSENIDRWMDELKATMRKIDSQLTSHKAERASQNAAYVTKGDNYSYTRIDNRNSHNNETFNGEIGWLEFQADEAAWKGSAARFKRSAQDRLTEAKQIYRTYHPVYEASNTDSSVEVIRLRSAIDRHKAAFEDDPSSEDEILWKAINDSKNN